MIPGADKNRRQLEQLESMVESILETAMQLGETVGLGKGDVHFLGGILMGFYDILCVFTGIEWDSDPVVMPHRLRPGLVYHGL